MILITISITIYLRRKTADTYRLHNLEYKSQQDTTTKLKILRENTIIQELKFTFQNVRGVNCFFISVTWNTSSGLVNNIWTTHIK